MIQVIDSSTAPDDDKKEANESIKATAVSSVCCSVCNKNKAKYKCPRCMRPYCSVSCYQIHNNNDDDNGTFNDSCSGDDNACTTLFNKHQLSSGPYLTNNDKLSPRDDVLTCMHHDINDNLDNIEKRDASITQLLQTNNDNEEGLVDIMHAMTLDIRNGNDACTYPSILLVEKQQAKAKKEMNDDFSSELNWQNMLQKIRDDYDGEETEQQRLLLG